MWNRWASSRATRLRRFVCLRTACATLAAVALFSAVAAQPLAAQAPEEEPFERPGNPMVTWNVLTPVVAGTPGSVVRIVVKARIAKGWELYTPYFGGDSANGPFPMVIAAGPHQWFVAGTTLGGTAPRRRTDSPFETVTESWTGAPTIEVPIRILPGAPHGLVRAQLVISFQTCNGYSCFPSTEIILPIRFRIHARRA